MKATLSLEIEGSKDEIDSIVERISQVVKSHNARIRLPNGLSMNYKKQNAPYKFHQHKWGF